MKKMNYEDDESTMLAQHTRNESFKKLDFYHKNRR